MQKELEHYLSVGGFVFKVICSRRPITKKAAIPLVLWAIQRKM